MFEVDVTEQMQTMAIGTDLRWGTTESVADDGDAFLYGWIGGSEPEPVPAPLAPPPEPLAVQSVVAVETREALAGQAWAAISQLVEPPEPRRKVHHVIRDPETNLISMVETVEE